MFHALGSGIEIWDNLISGIFLDFHNPKHFFPVIKPCVLDSDREIQSFYLEGYSS